MILPKTLESTLNLASVASRPKPEPITPSLCTNAFAYLESIRIGIQTSRTAFSSFDDPAHYASELSRLLAMLDAVQAYTGSSQLFDLASRLSFSAVFAPLSSTMKGSHAPLLLLLQRYSVSISAVVSRTDFRMVSNSYPSALSTSPNSVRTSIPVGNFDREGIGPYIDAYAIPWKLGEELIKTCMETHKTGT